MPARMHRMAARSCIVCPWIVFNPWKSSGWWEIIRSTCLAIASSTIASVTSVHSSTDETDASLSPICSPELSHDSWLDRGAADSIIWMISLSNNMQERCDRLEWSDYSAFSSFSSSGAKVVMPALMRILYQLMSLRTSVG